MSKNYYLGVFDNEHDVIEATRITRESGYDIHDVYTPYAVHGLPEAMGVKSSRLTWVCLFFALCGYATTEHCYTQSNKNKTHCPAPPWFSYRISNTGTTSVGSTTTPSSMFARALSMSPRSQSIDHSWFFLATARSDSTVSNIN